MHAQRVLMLAGVGAIAVGYWLPWTSIGESHRNAFDAGLFRVSSWKRD